MHPDAGPQAVCDAIREFLASARMPVLLDPGEEPLPIEAGNIVLTPRGGAASIECWSQTRNLVRRVRRVAGAGRGRLELEVERFGNRTGTLLLVDRAEPRSQPVARHGARLQYRERFRLSLRRQFPDWKLAELTTEADLHHSLSPSYARALLRKGSAAFAAIGASQDCPEPDGALSFGLIWLDYLRRREKRLGVEGLAVFLPQGQEDTTCHRIRCLDSRAARYGVFIQIPDGYEDAIDVRDYTNLQTRLEPFSRPPAAGQLAASVASIAAIQGVEQRPCRDGSISLSVRGLEFARTSGPLLTFGIDQRRTAANDAHIREIRLLAADLLRLRRAGADDRLNPLYTRLPEAWLESQARRSLETLEPSLQPSPVYSQTPHTAGHDRGLIDLLAADRTGRLAVIEIKAAADIHLPLQALDYWIRVKWHLERGEFTTRGYFPGQTLLSDPPRLLLVAPALDFHPTNDTVLRYFSPEVPAERVGVGLEWRQELRVMFRAPASRWPSNSSARSARLSEA